MSDRNAAIRALIEHRFPDATPVTHRTAEPVATGIDALDAILPGRGLPRGRLTVWMPQGGATAVLRAACNTTVAQGERAVWIDGLGTVAGPFWEEGPILVRPRNRKHGLRGAEELLRCGGFALVVLAASGARRHRNGAALPRRARRWWRVRHSHQPRIDGEPEGQLADPARELPVEKNSFWRSGGGAGCDDPRSRSVTWLESECGHLGARRAVRFEGWGSRLGWLIGEG